MRRFHAALIPFLMTFFLFGSHVWSQKKKLTYEQAYQKGEPLVLIDLPEIDKWLDDSHYLEKRPDNEDGFQIIKVHAETGREEIFLADSDYRNTLPENVSFDDTSSKSDDYTKFVFKHKDDLFFFDRTNSEWRQLTHTQDKEKNPHLSPDSHSVAFTRNHDLYVLDIKSGKEKQLTKDGSDVLYNGWASWVYYEEILGRRSEHKAFWWSPNSEMIAFLQFDDSLVPEFPIFRSEGQHGKLRMTRYPKAGDPNPCVRLGIAHVQTGEIIWVDTDPKADHYIAWPFWTPDSKQLFFQWMNRGQDILKIFSADPASGEKILIYKEKQDAWVDFFEDIRFVNEGREFIIISDKSGWSHLYLHHIDGKLIKQLTKGAWNARRIIHVDDENGQIYFQGSDEEDRLSSHLFRVSVPSGRLLKLTSQPGTHRCRVSTQGTYILDMFRSLQHPGCVDLLSSEGKKLRQICDSRLPGYHEYDWGKSELFQIPSGDGFDLPAQWTLPPDFDENTKYPVIFFQYSGPGSADASNDDIGLRQHFLVQNGIIAFSVDHRGSRHFGKKGTIQMHRNLGKWEIQDLVTAVKWLCEKPFIDPEKIGITGGSYGGYVTCLALTAGAEYFTHGVAHASVTDWKLYDSVYSERYMDSPTENPDGYLQGSVLNYADKLKGKLYITHGTIDDNVHMQNSIQLIEEFIEGQKDFSMMVYPGSKHGYQKKHKSHQNKTSVQFWFKHFLSRELEIDQ